MQYSLQTPEINTRPSLTHTQHTTKHNILALRKGVSLSANFHYTKVRVRDLLPHHSYPIAFLPSAIPTF